MPKMFLNRKVFIGAMILSIILIGSRVSFSEAMTSETYSIPSNVIDTFGSSKKSTNYNLYDSGGQPSPVGTSESLSGLQMAMGFIYTTIFGGGAAPTNLTIEVVAVSDAQRNVRLFWEGGGKCDVWVHNGSYTSSSEIYDYTGSYTKTYADKSSGEIIYSFNPAATPATQEYFAVAPSGMNSNFAESIAGRFDIEISRDNPSKVFMSVPLVMYNKNVQKTLTTQAKTGDAMYVFNADGTASIGGVYIDGTWYDWATGGPSTLNIDLTQGYAMLLGEEGSSSRTLTFAGTISVSPETSRTINQGWQMIGRAYPVGKLINEADLNILSSGDPIAELYEFDSNWSITSNHAALHIDPGTWYDWATGSSSAMNLEPGKVYWLNEPTISSIAWKQKP